VRRGLAGGAQNQAQWHAADDGQWGDGTRKAALDALGGRAPGHDPSLET